MISIRRQLTRDLVLALAVLLGSGLVAIGLAVRWALVASFDDALRAQALSVSSLTEIEDGKVAFDFSADFLRAYGESRPRNYFEIWDVNGAPLTRSVSLGQSHFEARDFGLPDRPKFWNFTLPNGRLGRAVAFVVVPTVNDAVPFPPAVRQLRLMVAVDRENFSETLTGLLAGVTGCGVVLLAAVFFVVPRVLRRGLAPLDRLGKQAERIDAATLATRFPVQELPAELQPIATRLNDLLARLEASFERERRFSADLAHELRTPLAELRSLAECALKWPDAREGATDRETLAIARQMETMVGHMLALARGEQGQIATCIESVAVDGLVAEVWATYAGRAEARGLRVELALASATAPADPVLLRSILANLCDNAVEYAAPHGPIMIKVETDEGQGLIRFINAADRLDAADVPKLFDRFWRKEAARSGGQHVGLGLALARTMALAMGWEITAVLEPDHRLVFTLCGPKRV